MRTEIQLIGLFANAVVLAIVSPFMLQPRTGASNIASVEQQPAAPPISPECYRHPHPLVL